MGKSAVSLEKTGLLEDVSRFQKVMHDYIKSKFEDLSNNQKETFYKKMVEVYIREDLPDRDCKWVLENPISYPMDANKIINQIKEVEG